MTSPDRPDHPARTDRTAHHELRYLILAAQREGSRRLGEALRHLGLTPAQAEVLDVLAGHGPLTLAALGRLLVCEQGSPSRLVDSLVQRELVNRAPHQQDKRAVLIDLTDAGRGLAARLGEASDRLIDGMSAVLSGEDADTLVRLLRPLLDGTHGGHAIRTRFPDQP
ncbi:MarR family transcriptional regulator [Kitasatospora sp. MAP5-34]|uniref:MarR family winged helix-turn-helix transcriptional regulator n=1 Tax=Kitasatospora sp. MAP5-34 TaxID=3035102 RepID=UPI0024746954|nr:MarR family transcriptional regulator [Kitasatospora sp. MAP5-34]MDH6577527.1 DNA-binding MarR family transcriptional regulator [Kitasatospora sp. MAP5-34]